MPYEIIRKNQRCYEVKNSQTGRIHAKCTSKKKAEAQVRLLEQISASEQDGGAIIDIIRSVADRLSLKKREPGKLPPKSRQLLQQVGGEPITKMVLVRTPIESYINKTLGLVSLGSWQSAVKSAGYDKLFHLSIFINDRYVLHKIEVTTFAQENPIKQDSETMEVPLGSRSITIGELIDKTKQYMGDQKFTDYDPIRNNCQVFVDSVLSANGLNSPQLKQFVLQDAVKIFEKTPSLTGKFAQFVTDIGARVNRLVQGEGKKSRRENKWMTALQIYNKNQNKWCFPKKNTKEYEKVMKIMEKL